MFIIRKRLTSNEGQPPDTRYDEDTDTVVTSTDGGTTWNENPGADPRVNPAYGTPAPDVPDPRCGAAEGMVAYIGTVVDAVIDGSTIAGIANFLFAAVLVFLPVSWMFALFMIVAEAFVAIGSAALAFSFTEAVYDELKCILLEHIDADGKIDDNGLADAQAQIDSQIADVTVSTTFDLIKKMVGSVGFSNAGAKFAPEDADCGDCVDLCASYLGGYGLGAMNPVEGSSYDAVNDWLLGADFGGAFYTSAIVPVVEGIEYTIAINGTWANQTMNGDMQLYWIQGTDFGSLIGVATIPGMGDGDNTPFWHSTDVPAGYDGLYLTAQAVGGSASVIIKGVAVCEA